MAMRLSTSAGSTGLLLIMAALLIASIAEATETAIETPSAGEFEANLPEGAQLDGKDLYDRLLKNRKRLRVVYQEGRILSTDPAGNPQQTNYWLRSKDYRDENDQPVGGVNAKLMFKVTGPREMRHTGYLYIHTAGEEDDQFMYTPHRQRTFRVILKGQTLAGTDFSFDDFMISLDDIEDAEYKRHPDETVDGSSCYVVEALFKPTSRTTYGRSISYLEKDHYVPLRTRYWDKVGVEVKELKTERDSIQEFGGAWIATVSTMLDLKERTSSTLHIDRLDVNPPIEESDFSVGALAFHP